VPWGGAPGLQRVILRGGQQQRPIGHQIQHRDHVDVATESTLNGLRQQRPDDDLCVPTGGDEELFRASEPDADDFGVMTGETADETAITRVPYLFVHASRQAGRQRDRQRDRQADGQTGSESDCQGWWWWRWWWIRWVVWDSHPLHKTLHCSADDSTVHCSSVVEYTTAQCSAVQCSAVEYTDTHPPQTYLDQSISTGRRQSQFRRREDDVVDGTVMGQLQALQTHTQYHC
jgi:hypothetical protein